MAGQTQKTSQGLDDRRLQRLAELLDEQTVWPSEYLYKFIVPAGQLDQALQLFPLQSVSQRESRTGKYVSLSSRQLVASSNEVIALYRKAALIPGLVAL